MMPGEAQVYRAFLASKDIVENVASHNLGFKPDSGFRPATAQERIQEWGALSPAQRNAIIDKMGIQWYISQAEEIQKLQEALEEVPKMPLDPGGPL